VFETSFFSSFLLPVSLAFVMLGMGLSLTRKDFAAIFVRPKAMLTGLVAQMLFLPVLAFTIALIFDVPPVLKVGLVLVAICPGGATSNMLNYLLNGNLALCVSMTTINSFLTQFSIPLLLSLSLRFFMHSGAEVHLHFWHTFIDIVITTLVPVVIGIMIRAMNDSLAEKLRKPMKMMMPALMAIAILGAILLEKKENEILLTTRDYMTVLPMTVLLNIGALLGGYYIARMTRLSKKSRMTIALEVGLHNTFLAIFIATGILHNASLAIPATMYALFSFFTSALFGVIVSGEKLSIRSIITGKKDSK
jgi:BASS family bile acid:Na+ symporter